VRIGVVGGQSAVEFILMRPRDFRSFGLGSNAVPDLLYEQDALGEVEPIDAQRFGGGMPRDTSSSEISRSPWVYPCYLLRATMMQRNNVGFPALLIEQSKKL
jgi:hypothetical protein